MHRFFVSPESISDDRVTLEEGIAAQIARVLRGRPGDTIMVLDGSGMEYRVVLCSVSVQRVIGDVVGSSMSEGEPGVEITLYQAIIKGDKFEYVLQKCTELGVSAFVPMVCERLHTQCPAMGQGTLRAVANHRPRGRGTVRQRACAPHRRTGQFR